MSARPLKLFWTVLVAILLCQGEAQAQVDVARFEADLKVLAGVQTRLVGSPGYNQSIDYIRQQIAGLPNVELKEHAFDVMSPLSGGASVEVDGVRTNVYPFFPASVRLNTTPAEGISGKLVYCGRGDYSEIAPGQVNGNIALIEAAAGDDWKTVAYFGARAVIVLGTKDIAHTQLRSHDVAIPINIPRFFLPEGDLANRLRQKAVTGDAVLRAAGDWERVKARNLYAYVAPQNPLPIDTKKDRGAKPWAALTIVVPVDAAAMVPDFAPAAGQAVQPAAALAMLRDFAANPPKRPVLVVFTSGDGMNLQGTRNMLMALADPPQKWRDAIAEVDTEIAGINADLARARETLNDATQLDITRDRSLVARIVKLVETDIALEQDQLFRKRLLPEEQKTGEVTARVKELEARQVHLGQIKYGYTSNPKSLGQYGNDIAQYQQRILARLGGDPKVRGLSQQWADRRQQIQDRIDLYEWLAGKINRNKDPNPRYNDERLLEVVVGLDLSDRGERCGPMFWGRLYGQSTIAQIQEYKEWFDRRIEAAKAGGASNQWFIDIRGVLDFESLKLTRTPLSYLSAPVALPHEMGMAWGVPAFSMATFEDLRPRRDTPSDTLENLHIKAIIPQLQAVHTIIRAAWDDRTFLGQPEFRRSSNQFTGQVVSTASGRPIPDLPREGFLATYYYTSGTRKIPVIRPLATPVGVRRIEVRDCDSEGRYWFDGLPRLGDMKQYTVKVYRFDKGSGELTASTDLGKQSAEIKNTVTLDQQIVPVKSVVFDCEEFTLLGLYDPRFLQALGEVQLMDARRNAEPQRFDCALWSQMMAGQLEPGTRAYLLFRYGRIGNRIILLNMPEKNVSDKNRAGVRGEGDGYLVNELSRLGPLALVTARDFWRLNDTRIEQYRKAGVTSNLIDSMHSNGKAQIDAAEAAINQPNAVDMMRNAAGAWADSARVYDAAQKMANDVIYAAIFLLLLAVPFSFCMERLLVASPSIYKQIGYTCFIFGLMALALWLFHPAFKISNSPLIIILAFAIMLMSIVVIGVVYSKFDTELKRIRSGRGSAEGASFARASVLMSAIMLGIANMRRRKFRTALTSITVVLITFAVLCFTSASRYQSTISLPTGEDASHPGLLLRQRGFRAMPVEALDSLRAAYPNQQFVERWWTTSTDNKEQTHIIAGGVAVDGKPARVAPMQAILGLSPGESQLSLIDKVIPNYGRLEGGEERIIYMAQSVADQIKVKLGDRVQMGGVELEIAGLFDANDFEQRVLMLSGEPLAPLKYSAGALDASGRRLTDGNDVNTLDLDADSSAAEASVGYEHLPPNQFAIVPAAVVRRFENTTLRTVGVRVAGDDEKPADKESKVKAIVDDITKRFALATFAGYPDGVKLVSASNLSSIGGGANVAIPLAIGGLIIFNTMMGSIAERRREIHVYTSLGLAPLHVGALFVAEAMTYGLIGSVFGYIIGQGVGTLLLKLGWLGNVTLNYSGTSAMLTMGLILLIVLLSALVPARLASKIAAPSIERSWRVPAPQGDQIIASLPFTINQTAAQGVIGYLAEFFEAHQEGSIGKFSAGKIEAFAGESGDGKPTRGLKTVVWLTPFDLGVRQHLLLLIHPGDIQDIYEVQVVLQRLSGDDGSWWRMNRSFLTELRKQFLQWRSLTPQRMKDYVDESKKLFAIVPETVVTTEKTEEVRLG